MLQLHLSDQQFNCLLRCVLYLETWWYITLQYQHKILYRNTFREAISHHFVQASICWIDWLYCQKRKRNFSVVHCGPQVLKSVNKWVVLLWNCVCACNIMCILQTTLDLVRILHLLYIHNMYYSCTLSNWNTLFLRDTHSKSWWGHDGVLDYMILLFFPVWFQM